MNNEEHCAKVACEVVRSFGGFATFSQYDEGIKSKIYFAPFHWAAGWGNPVTHRRNTDKMCAFQAVKMGLLKQTDTGYEAVAQSQERTQR
jgi:hypothetical protein